MQKPAKSSICGLTPAACERFLRSALQEDIGRGDITSLATIPAGLRASGRFTAKEAGVVAGLPLLGPLFRLLDARCSVKLRLRDGAPVRPRVVVATIAGPARAILAGERVALNLLQHLSGVATLTTRFVKRTRRSGVKILDTRKTLPGLRALQKCAVRAGGGQNHRFRLDEQALVKDNHLSLLGGGLRALREALARCRSPQARGMQVEIEVSNRREAAAAARAGANIIMLDNMRIEEMRQAVRLIRAESARSGRPILVEASGGVTLRNVAAIARTGVDWISVGSLTHSAPALDISLELDPLSQRSSRGIVRRR